MFGNHSNNKGKRRSFFLFGTESSSTATPPSTTKGKTSTKTGSRSQAKPSHTSESSKSQHQVVQPLSKAPLNTPSSVDTNRRDQTSGDNNVSKSKETEIPKNKTPALYNTPCQLTMDTESTERKLHSTNPFNNLANNVQDPTPRTKTRTRRPPPPELDMDHIKRLADLEKVELATNKPKVSSERHLEDTIQTAESMASPRKTFPFEDKTSNDKNNEAIADGNRVHRKNRSQAEQLVDDIDVFLEENPASLIAANEESGPDDYLKANGSTDSLSVSLKGTESMESSTANISPLDFGGERNNLSHMVEGDQRETTNYPGYLDGVDNAQDLLTSDSKSFDNNLKSGESNEQFSFSNSIVKTRTNEWVPHLNIEPPPNDILGDNLRNGGDSRKSTNPFLDIDDTEAVQQSFMGLNHHVLGDANSISAREIADQNDSELLEHVVSYSSDDAVIQDNAAVRKFRVVNEDHATFYFNGNDDNGTNDDGEDEKEEGSDDSDSLMESSSMTMDIVPPTFDNSNHSPVVTDSSRDTILNSHLETNRTFTPTLTNDPSFAGKDPCLDSRSALFTPTSQKSRSSARDERPFPKLEAQTSSPSKKSNSPASKSTKSFISVADSSTKSDRPSRLISSYVEELRLKYYKTSNFLQAPPNLPLSLKQKNNLVQPKNIRVKIRTNTKQIGIKHGKVKQKLLTLETPNDENSNPDFNSKLLQSGVNVDHTKEFHRFFNKDLPLGSDDDEFNEHDTNADGDLRSDYMKDIPGDEAYNSDDVMAPLRKPGHEVSRSNTTSSYYTRSKNKLKKAGMIADDKPSLPANISVDKYRKEEAARKSRSRSTSVYSVDSKYLNSKVSGTSGLHVANPDSDDES